MIDEQSFYCEYKIVAISFFANWNEKSNTHAFFIGIIYMLQTNPCDCGVAIIYCMHILLMHIYDLDFE